MHDTSYYTTNKDHIYFSLEGISLHVQAHNQDELAHANSTCYWEMSECAELTTCFTSPETVQGTLSSYSIELDRSVQVQLML